MGGEGGVVFMVRVRISCRGRRLGDCRFLRVMGWMRVFVIVIVVGWVVDFVAHSS